MSFFKRLLRSALIAPFLVATANAVILDWNTVSWTAGSLRLMEPRALWDTGAGSGNGNVNIGFGGAAIKPLTFTYGSDGPTDVTDPTYQHVGIDGISFTPIPEVNPAWSAVGSCLLAFALILRHSAKFRK